MWKNRWTHNFQSSSEFKLQNEHDSKILTANFQSSSEFKFLSKTGAPESPGCFQSSSEFKVSDVQLINGVNCKTFNPLLSLRIIQMMKTKRVKNFQSSSEFKCMFAIEQITKKQ